MSVPIIICNSFSDNSNHRSVQDPGEHIYEDIQLELNPQKVSNN